jgi:hypothetical protein
MAFSFQPFSPLASVQPISLGGLDVSQIRPISPFVVANTHPEYVAQGIASGTKDIASGILTGVKAAREQKLQDLKDQRDLAKEVIKLKAAKEEKNATLVETMRHHKELERLSQERIKNVIPANWGGDSSETTDTEQPLSATQPLKTPSSTLPTQDRYERHAPVGGNTFETINLPEDLNNDSNLIQTDRILGDLNYPVPLETAPTPLGQNAVNALANVDWSSVRANLGSSTSAGASPIDIPATIPSFAKAKPPASLSTLGGVSNEQMTQIQQQLAEMPLKSIPPVSAPAAEPTKFGVPKAAFRSYEEARKYIESQSGNPIWYAEGTPKPDKSGLFIIPWKQSDPAARAAKEEAQKTREEAQKTREMTAKSQAESRTENAILREARAFGLQKPVANFLSKGGVKDLLPPFLSAYESAKLHPEASGAADVSMLDSFGRAESGGRITVSQAHLIENAMSLKDKYLTKTRGKIEGGGFLPQSVRDQMLRELTENYNIGADSANKVVTATKQRLKSSGIPEEKAGVYYFTGGHAPETEVMLKSDALERIKSSREEMAALIAQKSQSSPEEIDIIDKKIQALKERAKIYHDRLLDEADVDSSLLGMKKIRDINIPEGFGGGDSAQFELVPR